MDNVKVKEFAGLLSNTLERKSRDNGVEFVSLKDGSPEWMTNVVRSVHGDKLPDDTVYEFISRCADALADSDSPEDTISELEPDVYTPDLTAWLNRRVDHVEYLSEVLAESTPGSGFDLLAMAQKKQLDEVGFALISALSDVETESQVQS